MNDLLVGAAPLCSLLGGIFCLFFFKNGHIQRYLSILTALAHLTFSAHLFKSVYYFGPQVLKLGNWPAPFGITYVADLSSSILLIATGLISLTVAIYNLEGGIDSNREKHGYHALSNFLVFGVSAAFVTGDIFHLYVCFEILLMSSFVLMVIGNTKAQLKAAYKYLVINLLSSTFFLISVGLLYAQVGTLNFADLYTKLSTLKTLPTSLEVISHMTFIAFAIKAGMFPLFFWLPASYHTPPIPTAALFAGLLTKVGLYSLIRLYTFVFPHQNTDTFEWMWILSVLTMVIGVLGAVSKMHIRRILSVHIISQVGYVTLALSLNTTLSIAAALFYMVHNMVAKTGLFLVSGVVESSTGSDYLKKCGGLFSKKPFFSVLFLILALGLAGLPPLSGFFAKLFVVQSALAKQDYHSIIAALAVSVLTLFSMIKIWNEAFWKPLPAEVSSSELVSKTHSDWNPQIFSVMLLAVGVLSMGVFAGPVFEAFLRAAETLTDPQDYLNAVFFGSGGAR